MSKKINLLMIISLLALALSACQAPTTEPAATLAVETTIATDAAAAADTSSSTDPESITAAYAMVDSGQELCYNDGGEKTSCPAASEAFYGQDAQFSGNAPSYTDNGDGTVTDNVTGLMWQQTPPTTRYNWSGASDYCESLTLGEFDDWYLPSAKALFSISNFSSGWPYLDTSYFDLSGQDVSKDEQYWSSNYYLAAATEAMSDKAFGVNHGTGHIKAYPAQVDGGPGLKTVRCARGDASYLENDFVDNGDGTITDNASGLMWLQDDSGSGLDWESALAYASNATDAGYDDWRVPSVKELQSIIDYSGVYPAINPTYFNVSDADAYFWTSTSAYFSPATPGYYYAWYVAFGFAVDGEGNDSHGAGAVRFDTKVEGGPAGEDPERIYNYVRLVRGGDVSFTPDGDPTADDSVEFVEPSGGANGPGGPEGAGGANPGPNGGQQGLDLGAAAEKLGVTEEALQAALGDPSQGPPDFAAAAKALGVAEADLRAALEIPNE